MLATFILQETTPAAPGTAASAVAWTSAGSFLPAGVAGPLGDYDAIDIVAELVGATGGTLDVYVQTSHDGGQTWYDSVHFTQLTASGSAAIWRTSVTHFAQPSSAAPVAVGKNLSPALAANTTVQGGWGDRARLVYVAGSGTSAGASIRVTVSAQRPDPYG